MISSNGVSTLTLGEVAEVRMGYPFRSRIVDEAPGEVLVIQMKDIDESGYLTLDSSNLVALPDLKPHHMLRAGDVLFRSRGRSNAAAVVTRLRSPTVLAAPLLVVRPKHVDSHYLAWLLNSPRTQRQLGALARGTSVQMISAESLKTLQIPVPSLHRQRRIVDTARLAEREEQLLGQLRTKRRMVTEHLLLAAAGRPDQEKEGDNGAVTPLPPVS